MFAAKEEMSGMNSKKAGFAVCFSGAMFVGLVAHLGDAQAETSIPTDRAISAAVETDIWMHPAIDANTVDIQLEKGIVTLTGTVSNLLAKDTAKDIAASIVGVRAVVNRIRVEPSAARSDEKILEAVRLALVRDPAADAYQITVSVSDGIVTLAGQVDSWAERQLGESVAKGVRGAKEIKNKLVIKQPEKRNDSEIKQDVIGLLANNVRVDDYLIAVKVDDGNVSLSGMVGSLAERNLAEAMAFSVFGVVGVENRLGITLEARDGLRRKSLFVARSDEEIGKAVKDAFAIDPRLISWNPMIEVDSGTVTLKGAVEDLGAKTAAEQNARNVVGVVRVRNFLKVKPDVRSSDEDLAARIAAALRDDPFVARFAVSIDVDNGSVILSGTVNNTYEKDQAERVVSRVKGVTRVSNKLSFERVWRPMADADILKNVRDQLYWSPFVDQEKVVTAVENGVVTLSGTVNTWVERDAAGENAWEAGAKDVRNRLVVKKLIRKP